MTETEVEIKQVAAYSDYIANDVINERLEANMKELLPIGYTDDERAYAEKFAKVITDLDRENVKKLAKKLAGKDAQNLANEPIWDFLCPSVSSRGSTDVGDVSWVCPTGWFRATTLAVGTPGHAWQVVAQGKSPIAHKGMLFAAKVLAATAYDFLTSPELVAAAHENHTVGLDGETYPNALPKDAKPEIW